MADETSRLESRSKRARTLFEQGYNCAQSVFAAFCDETGMSFETALKLSAPFGGGMGRLREVCGAVTAMLMITGLKWGYTNPNDDETKAEHYRLVQSLAHRFGGRNGSFICRDLLGLAEGADDPMPAKRDAGYYQTRPCVDLVECAAEMMETLIKMEDNMKIAVASEKDMVTEHFGHCENFNIFTVENGKIISREAISNPGHKPGFLPNFLNDMGVRVIISGGMGGGAVQIFEEKGIEVFTGVRGSAASAVESYISGSLKSTGSVCHEHAHMGDCGE